MLAQLINDASTDRVPSCSGRVFNVQAVQRILCRVWADLTQEPLDFVAEEMKTARIRGRLTGAGLMRVFGNLAEEISETSGVSEGVAPAAAPVCTEVSVYAFSLLAWYCRW
jgi:hypothetical protein